jgi:hypothetical protein
MAVAMAKLGRDLHIGCGRALKIGTRGCAVLGASSRAHCGRLAARGEAAEVRLGRLT